MNFRHWKEPDALGMCVNVGNALADWLSRLINFLQPPVPLDRTDGAFYAPLENIALDPVTDIFWDWRSTPVLRRVTRIGCPLR